MVVELFVRDTSNNLVSNLRENACLQKLCCSVSIISTVLGVKHVSDKVNSSPHLFVQI